MPKKIICLSLLILFLTCPTKSFAEDFDMSSALTDLPDMDNIWQGQKQITNKEFEQVMTELEKRKGKKKEKPMPGNSITLMMQETFYPHLMKLILYLICRRHYI